MLSETIVMRAVEMYKYGAIKAEVARMIQEEAKLGSTQSKKYASEIWEEEIGDEYVPSYLRAENKEGESSEFSELPLDEFEHKKESVNINESSYSINGRGNPPSEDEIFERLKIDKTEWKIVEQEISQYQVARKNKDASLTWKEGVIDGHSKDRGNMFVQDLYSIKLKLKRVAPLPTKELFETLKGELKQFNVANLIVPKSSRTSDNALLISIADQHLGKIGYDYSHEEVIKQYEDCADYFLDRASERGVDKIIFNLGNDLCHIDGHHNSSTKGTRQDVGQTWKKIFKDACKVNYRVVGKCLSLAPTEVVVSPGNHGLVSDTAVGECVDAFFYGDKNLVVHNSIEDERRYIDWGKVLLGFTHGDSEKREKLPLLMATESSKFSACPIRFFFCGHIHTQRVFEEMGIIVEFLPTLCSSDWWHKKNGYVGNQRCSKAFLFNKEAGLLDNYYFNI